MAASLEKALKIFIQSPDKQGRVDPTVRRNVLDFIPNQVPTQAEADIVIIPISWMPKFEFNEELEQITKPICVIDFCEWGTNWRMELTHRFGGPQEALSCSLGASWQRFDSFVGARQRQGQLKLYFSRELLEDDVGPTLKPIEFPAYIDIPPIQNKEQFDSRPLEVFFNWGYSHTSRPHLHADIFRATTTHGIEVISSFQELEARKDQLANRYWASIHTHHAVRRHISEIIPWQEKAKITVALPGNGRKTFRHGETQGSIMALLEDKVAWSYPWIHGENCIRLVEGREFDCLEASTRREDLYQIYRNGQETLAKYCSKPYVQDYVLPTLEAIR